MADEDVKGTSADAEVPGEDENVTEPTEAAEQEPEAAAEPEPEAVAEPEPETAAEPEPEAAAETAEDAAEPEASTEPEPATTPEGEPAAEAAGTSAEAEVPRKRKRLPRRLRPEKTRPKRTRASGERSPIVRLEKPVHERGRRQERQGKVVSDAMEKTIVVEVAVVKAHPRYKKVVRRSVKFHAHDERGEAKVGDLVRIVETRPLSRTKRWRLVEVLEAAK
jgi:small subunit ribosomal protein S17